MILHCHSYSVLAKGFEGILLFGKFSNVPHKNLQIHRCQRDTKIKILCLHKNALLQRQQFVSSEN